jgi:hypothetical protein
LIPEAIDHSRRRMEGSMRILFSTALTGNLTFSLYYPLFIQIANGVPNLLFVRSSRSAYPSTKIVYLIVIQPV